MQQTGYQPILPFSKGLTFNGGFCEWWFTPWQNILVWPGIDPLTQFLVTEPSLAPGATWLGPIKVPNTQLGFSEEQQNDSAGIYYKTNVSGNYPGDSGTSRVNLENIPYNKFAIVGKMRAGGLFLLVGNDEYGLTFNHKYNSDKGAKGTAGSDFNFGYETINKAVVLKSFLGQNVTPPPDGSNGGTGPGQNGSGPNRTMIIPFNNTDSVSIPWTSVEQANFGIFPLIEVWFNGLGISGNPGIVNVPIFIDADPPNTTLFSVQLTGLSDGFIVIK